MSLKEEKFRVSLFPKADRNGKTFYMGKAKFPGNIDFRKGVVFWVFTSVDGEQELQIAEHEDDAQFHSRRNYERNDEGSVEPREIEDRSGPLPTTPIRNYRNNLR